MRARDITVGKDYAYRRGRYSRTFRATILEKSVPWSDGYRGWHRVRLHRSSGTQERFVRSQELYATWDEYEVIQAEQEKKRTEYQAKYVRLENLREEVEAEFERVGVAHQEGYSSQVLSGIIALYLSEEGVRLLLTLLKEVPSAS